MTPIDHIARQCSDTPNQRWLRSARVTELCEQHRRETMTDTINDGGPAFPANPSDSVGSVAEYEPGMSLRQWYAGQIAASMFNGMAGESFRSIDVAVVCARTAFAAADALIAEGAKP